ncbi:MAG: Rid family detoxifying hydrolase [Solirubrobacteraceae bacterium]
MPRIAVNAPAAAAAAVGPYSHAVDSGGLLFLSGQTPLDGSTGALVTGGIDVQTRQCFANLGAVLQAAGLSFDDVVKCTVFLRDMADFAAMNSIYAEQFSEPAPARTTIGVASLPLDAQVEIELIARRPAT